VNNNSEKYFAEEVILPAEVIAEEMKERGN
jgi:hypothetical protein